MPGLMIREVGRWAGGRWFPGECGCSLHFNSQTCANGTTVFQEGGEGDVLGLAFELSHVGAGDVHPFGHGLLGESDTCGVCGVAR